MKYVLLVYNDEALLQSMPLSDLDIRSAACVANEEALRGSGHLLAVQGLQSSGTATTLRVQHGKLVLSDGPYANTKEQLIGLFLIEARDLNQAIQIAAQMPQVQGGPIEVRPVIGIDGGMSSGQKSL